MPRGFSARRPSALKRMVFCPFQLDMTIDANQHAILVVLKDTSQFLVPLSVVFFIRHNSPPAHLALFVPYPVRSHHSEAHQCMIELFHREHIFGQLVILLPKVEACFVVSGRSADRSIPTTTDDPPVPLCLRVRRTPAIQSMLIYTATLSSPVLQMPG